MINSKPSRMTCYIVSCKLHFSALTKPWVWYGKTQTNLHWIRSALNPRLPGEKSSTLTKMGIWIGSSILHCVAVRQLATCYPLWPQLPRVSTEGFLGILIHVFCNFLMLLEACLLIFCSYGDCNCFYIFKFCPVHSSHTFCGFMLHSFRNLQGCPTNKSTLLGPFNG